MDFEGLSKEELFCKLQKRREEDISYTHILSSMCTTPHPVAAWAHSLFLETNLGDPGLFPGTVSLEEELIKIFTGLFHLKDAAGCTTSGGTESNIQVLRMAKTACQREPSKPDTKLNIVIPESAHFSFEKACRMMDIEMRLIPIDENYRMTTDKVAETIDSNTCLLGAIAGTTEYGMVDPIPALGKIAEEAEIPFHVDAAFGGLVLPFIKNSPPFDFSVRGVSSISVDPHKMGMSTIPCGVLMVRESEHFNDLMIDTPYLTVKQAFSLTGTRPGASVASAYAVLAYHGFSGMEAVVTGCMENTHRLIRGMETLGIKRKITPDVNVATFESCPVPEPWIVSHTRKGDLRIVCMPHVTKDTIETFIEDVGNYAE